MSDSKSLTLAEPEQTTTGPTDFSFVYRGIQFTGRRNDAEENCALHLVGDMAPLPYSAEAPVARVGISAIVMHANTLLGPRFRIVDQRIQIACAIPTGKAPSTSATVAAVAALLIPLSPYLDLLDVYLLPGGAGIRPEWLRKNRRAAPPGGQLALSAPR